MPDWSQICRHISDATGRHFADSQQRGVGGGSINAAHVLKGDDGREFFVKLNRASLVDMFEAEADGLNEMLSANTIKVPAPVCRGTSGGEAYIVMEYIPLGGKGSGEKLGEQLAAMHRKTWNKFGWFRDNTIGSTPQPNTPTDSWIEFYHIVCVFSWIWRHAMAATGCWTRVSA